MKKQTLNTNDIYGFLPYDIDGADALAELALNIRWSWNHAADEIWSQLNPALWELTHNPWIILQGISRHELEQQLAEPSFKNRIKELLKQQELLASLPTWFQQSYSSSSINHIAYFSMEYLLSEALPIYSGGLGNVAGDQLKAASDLGVPVTAVGLLYSKGYFRQEIDQYGNQQPLFPYNDPGQLPITPLRLADGEWLRIRIDFPGYPIWLRTWQVQVGRTKLLLLDSNDAANLPAYRGITSELYGGGVEMRIRQEIVLGIGGWKLLKALEITPEVCHMNEGHAAFVVLERASDFMKKTGITFEEALAVTRAGNLFTTHTAVAAGFDQFSPSLMWHFFEKYAREELGIGFDDLMALGRLNTNDTTGNFSMAYLAFHGSGAVNGVSRLHSKVSQSLFQNLFPRWPTSEVPVGYVTNGVHMPSWDSEYADALWTETCGKDRWRGNLEGIEQHISHISDDELWQFRMQSRNKLVSYIRQRFKRQVSVSGEPGLIETAKQIFNPDTLTLGFARRFVPYKRPDLLLHDPQRLIRILTNQENPIQLVIAGKAPPYDESGKALIRRWIQFIQQHNLYKHIIFLSDYDIQLTENLVQGVDVWLNTPRRPWEASGTSGMKVLVNGGINLSELDGWWAEAYTPEVGWALGDGLEHSDDAAWDAIEAEQLYGLLEQQVIPEFYTRNPKGIPEGWVGKIRKSMALLTPRFSANRTVRQYTEKYYLPAAASFLKRAGEKGAAGTRIMNTYLHLKNQWQQIKFVDVRTESIKDNYLFHVQVWLGEIKSDDIVVQLYAEGINDGAPVREEMQRDFSDTNEGEYVYKAQVTSARPASDYTVRIIPRYDGVSIPLENNLILWQR